LSDTLIAILDANNRLVGTRPGELGPGDVPIAADHDLPTDGTFKWVAEEGAFFPLGHGFARVSAKPPVSEAYVLNWLVQRAIASGENVPASVRGWSDWFEKHHKTREDERQQFQRLRPRRER